MPARAPRLAVLGLLFVAAQEEEQPVRDGTTFMLMGKGDRCLATSLDDTAVELVSGCEARLASSGAGGWRVTWTSLLAPGSRLYLRNGEVLLHALDDESTYTPTGETDDEKEQRIERSARWRVRGSPSRDKSEVALESIYGTFLRRAGATVEQGRNYEDDAIWWKIVPVTERCSPPTLGERLASALSQYGWPMDAPPSSPACTQASASSGLEATLTSNADGRASKSSPSPPPLRPSQSEAARSNPTPAQAQESLTPSQTTPKAEATTNEPAGQPAASRVEPAKEADTWPIGRRRRGLAIPGFSIAQIRFSPISSSWVTHAVSALSLPSRLPALQMRLPQLPAVPIPSIALNSHGVYAITSWVVLLSTAVFSGSLELVEPRRIGTIYDDVLRMLRTTAVSQPFAKLLESTSTIVARVGNIVALLPRALHACARTLRLNNDIAALLAHGAITNAASDVLAQVHAEVTRAAPAASVRFDACRNLGCIFSYPAPSALTRFMQRFCTVAGDRDRGRQGKHCACCARLVSRCSDDSRCRPVGRPALSSLGATAVAAFAPLCRAPPLCTESFAVSCADSYPSGSGGGNEGLAVSTRL